MNTDAVKVLRGRRVGVQPLGPLDDVVLVVVEADDLDARLLRLEHGPQVVAHKLRLVLRRVQALLPADVGRLGLVLHGHAWFQFEAQTCEQ